MAIISFWSEGDKETGKTLSLAAITTQISIENTYKTLIFNTEYNDSTLENCFWTPKKPKKEMFMIGNRADLATGTTGVAKAILSNKTSPEIIKNYTKTIYKNRLELLTEDNITQEDYQSQRRTYKEIAKIAKNYNITEEEIMKEFGSKEVLKYNMAMEKAVEVLKENN